MKKAENQVAEQVEIIQAYIDKYAELTKAIKKLEAEREKLRDILVQLPEGEHKGKKQSILIEKVEQEILDPLTVANYLKKKDFCEIVRVINEKAKEKLSKEQYFSAIKDRKIITRIKVK